MAQCQNGSCAIVPYIYSSIKCGCGAVLCWGKGRKQTWKGKGPSVQLPAARDDGIEGATRGWTSVWYLLQLWPSFFSIYHPPHFLYSCLEKLAGMSFWVWSILFPPSAAFSFPSSINQVLPWLHCSCCFSQGLPVPSDPRWAATDGGALVMPPVLVFPSTAVGSAKHPA